MTVASHIFPAQGGIRVLRPTFTSDYRRWIQAEHGREIRAENLPVERRVTHMIDVARALSYLAKDTEALDLLLSAERQAPTLVRHSASVREAVKDMHRRAPVTAGSKSSELLAFGQRCRAVR